MLIDNLNEIIIDMKMVQEMETVSADTKKQAIADYNFKQLVAGLQKTVQEVLLATNNTGYRPSANVIYALKSILAACDKVVQAGAANISTTQYILSESKKLYAVIGSEWCEYYQNLAANVLSLLDTVKGIVPDATKVTYATNKIKKAATWNTSVENYNSLRQGLADADRIFKDLSLDKDSDIMAFLKLVSEGNATLLDLTDEILNWIKKEKIESKIRINFRD